jgi:protein-tyrosine phosphatase
VDWITDRVAIGNYLEAQDTNLLLAHAIRSIVSLDGTLSKKHATDLGVIEVVAYSLIDGAGNDLRLFEYAVNDLERLVQLCPPVLVHCHAGRSRSVVVLAAYLMRALKLDPDAAIALVASKREINITSGFVDVLYTLADRA